MVLLDLWNADQQQITGKNTLLKVVSSEVIGLWLNECLEVRFTDFGFVLQIRSMKLVAAYH